eukprot:1641788-Rhodomonas_salina.3
MIRVLKTGTLLTRDSARLSLVDHGQSGRPDVERDGGWIRSPPRVGSEDQGDVLLHGCAREHLDGQKVHERIGAVPLHRPHLHAPHLCVSACDDLLRSSVDCDTVAWGIVGGTKATMKAASISIGAKLSGRFGSGALNTSLQSHAPAYVATNSTYDPYASALNPADTHANTHSSSRPGHASPR